MKLIVKGNRFDAAKAAANRGIPFIFHNEHATTTLGGCAVNHFDKVQAWFCEHSEMIPRKGYPNGTLLFYSSGY